MATKGYVRFDEIEIVLSSLDLLALVVGLVRKNPSFWKWAIIAAHDALQGAMVCAINDTSSISVLKEESARKMAKWLDTQEGKCPHVELAGFNELLKRCQDSSRMNG